jgi:hypothetical protein
LRWLFIAHVLRGAAEASVGLFVPIFLFVMGSELKIPFANAWLEQFPWMVRGIFVICAYYFTYRLLILLLTLPLTRVMHSLGLMKSMMVGNICSLAMYAMFFLSIKNAWFLLPATFFASLQIILYWIPYFTQFAIRADFKLLGQEVGAADFLDQLIRAGLPMLGGVVIGLFGFEASYVLGGLCMFGSFIALLMVQEVKFSFTASLKEFLVWVRQKKNKHVLLGLLGKYLDDCGLGMWPVYIFIFLGTVQEVGYLYSIVLFASLIMSYFMGWYLGKHKGRKAFFLSGGVLSALWMFRMFAQNVWHLFTVDLFDRLAISVYTPIYDLGVVLLSRGKQVFHFYVFRELVLSIIGVVFWLTIAGIFMLPIQWIGVFFLGGIGMLLSMNLVKAEQ